MPRRIIRMHLSASTTLRKSASVVAPLTGLSSLPRSRRESRATLGVSGPGCRFRAGLFSSSCADLIRLSISCRSSKSKRGVGSPERAAPVSPADPCGVAQPPGLSRSEGGYLDTQRRRA